MFVLGVTFGEWNNGTVDLAMALVDADYARPPFREEGVPVKSEMTATAALVTFDKEGGETPNYKEFAYLALQLADACKRHRGYQSGCPREGRSKRGNAAAGWLDDQRTCPSRPTATGFNAASVLFQADVCHGNRCRELIDKKER